MRSDAPPDGSVRHVAYAGEPGSFAEDAVLAAFDRVEAVPVPTFRDVFGAVEDASRGAFVPPVDAGVVPIENVVGGTVREVYDLLLEHALVITGEVIVPVRLCLAALPGERVEGIERVYSHIQALGQAEAFLRSRPWALLASTNTSGAGKMIRDRGERAAAAVLSPRAAAVHGLEILATGIESERDNRTRFLVLARPGDAPYATPRNGAAVRTTVVVGVHNEPGALHRVLAVLAGHGLNMSKLESRPTRERAWEYVFWIDVDGDLCGPSAGAALEALRGVAALVRVMGCYPVADEPAPR
jgi:prephenate dehydratase